MKPKAALRSFLFLAGSSLLAISYAHALDVANFYTTATLDVSSPETINVAQNFAAIWDGPVIGSSTLTVTSAGVSPGGFSTGQLSLINNTGNTFSGNILIDGAILRVAGNPFDGSQGFIAPNMGAGSTITINKGGTLNIDDTAGYVADRFGSGANRPAVSLTGGTLNLNGLNNASSSVQTLGVLTATSGVSTVNVTRNSNGNPTLTFSSLTQNKGSLLSFNGTNLGTGTDDARITFTSAPTPTNGILAGARFFVGSPGTSEFVTYDTNGIRAFTASDYTDFLSNDINAAGATNNVRMTGVSTVGSYAALSGDLTINSLHLTGSNNNSGTWAMGNKLTLTSGMLLRTFQNQALNITSGTLTAGTGSAPIDLNIIVAQSSMTIGTNAVINDNGVNGVVTLVKSGSGVLTLGNNSVNNGYTGGTYVNDGTLSTGSTADRRYLGSGKVVVDDGILSLGSRGATSNSTGDDYTAINGARINLGNTTYTAADTFNIGATGVISGNATALSSLTRGSNITLAADSIIAHGALTAALDLGTGTIQSIGTSADLYFGLGADQNNAGGQITIGSGTAFKGISGLRAAISFSDYEWRLGTINIASGTSDVYFQSNNTRSLSQDLMILGNAATAGGPVVALADAGTVDINVLGRVRVDDTEAVFGDTSTGRNVRFVATAGSTLEFQQAAGMGSGTGIASAFVEEGGRLTINNAAALNGAVTVGSGGIFRVNNSGGLTGIGALTFNEGSILEIFQQAAAFSGTQASAATINAGTIVRMNTGNWGTAGTTLDSVLGSGTNSVTYQHVGQNAVNPTSPNTAVYTLNKSGGGVGGVLTNDLSARTVGALGNGNITLGANGGVMAATTGTTLTVSENVTGHGSLTIGTTAIIDGAPKAGTVSLNTANDYSGGTTVNAGTLTMGNVAALGSTSGQLTVNGGTMNMNNQSLTVGNLTGTGGVISGGSSGGRTLTIGQGDFGGGNFQGVIANGTGGTTNLTKTGTGTITVSGDNTYTGTTAINVGTLRVNGDQSTASGSVTVAADATLGGTGTIGGDTTIADTGRLTFNLSTGPGSHNKLELATTKTFDFVGASTLTITSSGGASTGLYTLVTVPGAASMTGSVPATVFLPLGWTADLPQIVADGPNTSLQINITSTGGGGTPYENWATGGELFEDDANNDGVNNGLAFLLGAGGPNDNALGLLPTVTKTPGGLVLTFDMLDSASRGTAVLSVEHSSNLGIGDPWEAALVPDADNTVNDVVFDIAGSGTLDVEATIPASKAAGGKLFGRLKANNP